MTALEANDLKESEKSYELYKSKQVQYVNPSQDFHQSDIDFYNALGGQYMNNMSILPEGAQRDEIRAKGIAFFEKVLELDAENFQANFNVGLIHYNEGVDITMAMSGSTDLSIEMIIENTGRSEELFFTALPYLHKAEKMDPKSEETIEGITGCYYGLHDDENYNKYRKILDEMIIDDLLKSYDANPNDLDVVKELCRIYSTTIKNQQEYDKFKAVYDKLREN
ncbi:MAG: hypothetical protein MI810_15130 [Flavobacteriales bacterium]|nr:hypothetical protein [Flavobacteriales bacterium]